MMYIITKETLNKILSKLENKEIRTINIYKDEEKEYYLCDIELTSNKTSLNLDLVNEIYIRLKDFYFLYSASCIKKFELYCNMESKVLKVEESYTIDENEMKLLKDIIEHIIVAKNLIEEYSTDNLLSSNLYLKNYNKYIKADVSNVLNFVLSNFI